MIATDIRVVLYCAAPECCRDLGKGGIGLHAQDSAEAGDLGGRGRRRHLRKKQRASRSRAREVGMVWEGILGSVRREERKASYPRGRKLFDLIACYCQFLFFFTMCKLLLSCCVFSCLLLIHTFLPQHSLRSPECQAGHVCPGWRYQILAPSQQPERFPIHEGVSL